MQGQIPPELGGLAALKLLSLSRNELTGMLGCARMDEFIENLSHSF